jgi:MFS transporter, DHA1 family, inner membrane transport protein
MLGTATRDDGHRAMAWASVVLPAAASQLWFVTLPPFLPTIADAIGVSTALAGQIVGLPVLLAAVLVLFVGPLIDTYGHPRVMTVGLAAIAASSLGTAFATSAGVLLAARLVGSFGRAGVIPAAFVDAVERPGQDQRRRGTSWVIAGAAAAPLIGVPVLTLVGAHAGWRTAFVLVSVLAALSATLAWRQARTHPRIAARLSRPTLRSFRPLLSEPTVTTVLVSSLVGNTGLWVCLTYLGVLYQNRLGLGVQEVGWAITAYGLGVLAGSLASMDRRVGLASRRRLAATRAGMGLLLGLPFIVSVGATGAAAMLFGGGVLGGVQAAIMPLVLSRQPSAATGTVQSLNWLALTAGIAVGASFGGLLLAAGDLPFVGLGTLGLTGLAAVVLFWPRSGSRAPATQYQQS